MNWPGLSVKENKEQFKGPRITWVRCHQEIGTKASPLRHEQEKYLEYFAETESCPNVF